MTSPSEPRTTSLYHAAPRGAVAAWMAGVALAAMLLFELLFGIAGAPELMGIGGYAAAIGVLVVSARPLPGALGVRRVPVRFVIAGVLVGGASWVPRQWLVEQLGMSDQLPGLEKAVTEPSLAAVLLSLAILPAIAEELIFRGVIARSLARHSQVLAIAVSSILFALYHVVPVQMVAVFPFGLALGFIAVRCDSIVPTMIAHLVNNTIAIVLTRGDLDGPFEHAPLVLAGSSGIVAVGLALAWRIAP